MKNYSEPFVALFLTVTAFQLANSAAIKNEDKPFELIAGSRQPNDTLILTRIVFKLPIEGLVVAQTIGMTGLKENVSYVWVKEEGESQGATADIVCGGLGEHEVGVRFTSLVNRGFYFNYDIYGTLQDKIPTGIEEKKYLKLKIPCSVAVV